MLQCATISFIICFALALSFLRPFCDSTNTNDKIMNKVFHLSRNFICHFSFGSLHKMVCNGEKKDGNFEWCSVYLSRDRNHSGRFSFNFGEQIYCLLITFNAVGYFHILFKISFEQAHRGKQTIHFLEVWGNERSECDSRKIAIESRAIQFHRIFKKMVY